MSAYTRFIQDAKLIQISVHPVHAKPCTDLHKNRIAGMSGYKVGAKTGTSEKLPRSSNRYIASTLGFAPVENPVVLAVGFCAALCCIICASST